VRFIHAVGEPADAPSRRLRRQLAEDGPPSERVAAGYCWAPGSELAERMMARVRAGGAS
jgi:hypothetical protein